MVAKYASVSDGPWSERLFEKLSRLWETDGCQGLRHCTESDRLTFGVEHVKVRPWKTCEARRMRIRIHGKNDRQNLRWMAVATLIKLQKLLETWGQQIVAQIFLNAMSHAPRAQPQTSTKPNQYGHRKECWGMKTRFELRMFLNRTFGRFAFLGWSWAPFHARYLCWLLYILSLFSHHTQSRSAPLSEVRWWRRSSTSPYHLIDPELWLSPKRSSLILPWPCLPPSRVKNLQALSRSNSVPKLYSNECL